MKVNASPLAISCLIDTLIEHRGIQDQLGAQLNEIGVGTDWLKAISAKYRSFWEQTIEYSEPEGTTPVQENTVLLLSWLTTSIREPDLNSEINSFVFEKTSQAMLRTRNVENIPSSERISLTIGVVGRPVPVIDRAYPVWLPGGVLDQDVERAYEGLVEHVAKAPSEEWPEVYRTAVLWRLGGIAQGLTGGDEEVWNCMMKLNVSLNGTLPPRDRRMTSNEWIASFRQRRNVFTHIKPIGNLSFSEAVNQISKPDDLIDYVRLATFYAAISINERISNFEPETVEKWINEVERDQDWMSALA